MKPPKDDTARKLDAAVERLGVKMGNKRNKSQDSTEKSRRASSRLGLKMGQVFGLGLLEDE